MVLGKEARQAPVSLTEVVSSAKPTKGVRMDTSKVNETAPMIVRVAQGSLMASHGARNLFGSFGEHFTWRDAPYAIFALPAGG